MDQQNQDRFDLIEQLFLEAQAYPAGEREAFVEKACAGDVVLLNELRSLLEADELAEQEAFLQQPPLPPDQLPGAGDSMRGKQIGPYTVLRRLGRGGMGDVFLAQQERPFKRRVALKVIRRGMDTEEVLLRFKMERQILASLNHPNIARLLDGGVTEEDLPYFAMEYVDGLSITEYCDKNRLTIEERLRLFKTVCSAVQYAHQNLVLHRDLKPSNILVNEKDNVKLLDFGIAKMLNPSMSPMAMPVTRTELRVMTPEYASPEQVRGETLTTTSDIYALGVILYELLTGHRPYRIEKKSSLEMAEIVCNTDVERPSTRVSKSETITFNDGHTQTLTPEDVSSMRSVTVERLRRRLRGDLDNIVLMALRKEPSRRYASVEQLSQDITRYLEGRPVEARPATVGYRVRKFVIRHRAAVIATTLVLASLLAGLQAALWQAGVARTEAREAEIARQQTEDALQQSEEVTDFLMGLFSANDPAQALGQEITARQLLERGKANADELAEQPAVQARMKSVIGRVYQSLGQYEEAQPLLEEALQIRKSHFGEVHKDVSSSLDNLARLHRDWGNYETAEGLYREAIAVDEQLYASDQPGIAQTKNNLAILLRRMGRRDEAEVLYRDALAVFRAHYGDNEDVAQTLNNLAVLVHDTDHEAADSLYRQALDLQIRLHGEVHPLIARVLNNHALLLRDMGRLEEARKQMSRTLEMRRKLLGEEHPNLANTMNNLAIILRDQDEFEEAEKLLREALAMRRKLLGDSNPDVANSLHNVAVLLKLQGKYEEAESMAREAIDMQKSLLGETHVEVGKSTGNLAHILLIQQRYDEARPLFDEALRIFRMHVDEEHSWIQEVHERIALLPTA